MRNKKVLRLAHIQAPYAYKDCRSCMTHAEMEHVDVLARILHGKRIIHINATDTDGGAAHMLQSLVPFEKRLGLKSVWRVLAVGAPFLFVTRKIQQELQGLRVRLSDNEWKLYLEQSKDIGNVLAGIPADIVVIHDVDFLAAGHFADMSAKRVLFMHTPVSFVNSKSGLRLLPYQATYQRFFINSISAAPADSDEEKAFLLSQKALGFLELYVELLEI